ncbi:NAD(P)-dependent oxidoreductase [Pseudomonas sp. NFX224]|uniref:NAD(P)-dependent oxidoreductase n=1 Tax=Pseudomonas sp. NFX224 TaxID=3402862 RepID=UPI003AFB442E
MDVVILGITGRTGSRLSDELLRRGHKVTGVARNIEKVPQREGVTLVAADVTDTQKLAFILKGHKVVISATRFVTSDINSLITAVKEADVARLLVVGGAATLEVAPGVPMLDTPGFPDANRAEATAGREFLNRLRQEQSFNWTFLSPSADFNPGQRTGKFRLGQDTLLVDTNGKSWISMEDYAIAMADEVEDPKHIRQRFTVGY